MFYRTMRARDLSKNSNVGSEEKWHEALGNIFSTNIWQKIWDINKRVIVSNKMKWVGVQIIRFILPTNYTVNHYDKSVDPGCSLCKKSHLEKLPLLLWGCPAVQDFWTMVQNILTSYFEKFRLGSREAIFGDTLTTGDSVINTFLALSRQFIYKQKFTTKSLDEVTFINYMKKELKNLYNFHLMKEKAAEFIKLWYKIYDHFEVEYGLGGSREFLL